MVDKKLRSVLVFPVALFIRAPVAWMLIGISRIGQVAELLLEKWLRAIPGVERGVRHGKKQ